MFYFILRAFADMAVGGPTVYKILLNTAIGNLIIVCAGAIPGYWVTVATV